MEERVIAQEQVRAFEAHLLREEKSGATIEKYLRDVRAFRDYIQDQSVTRERLIAYKQELIARGYAVRTVNSVLASLGSLLSFLGWTDCKVRASRHRDRSTARRRRNSPERNTSGSSVLLRRKAMRGCKCSCRPFAAQGSA